MMDLTVFNGESNESLGQADDENDHPFASNSEFNENKNQIKLKSNKSLGISDEDVLPLSTVFSSRQWGNAEQKAFGPQAEKGEKGGKRRPNPWCRAFSMITTEGGASGASHRAGLQEPDPTNNTASTSTGALKYVPQHTLGFYNNRGEWGYYTQEEDAEGNTRDVWHADNVNGTRYRNLLVLQQTGYTIGNTYWGAPERPFEHLTWNDAPYSNPAELMDVPASQPGRFGLEFIRGAEKLTLNSLYSVKDGEGHSLGSEGVFGYEFKKPKSGEGGGAGEDKTEKMGKMSATLNFFNSSKMPGESLNLAKLLDFVTVPSNFMGTRTLAGYDADGYLIGETDPDDNLVGNMPRDGYDANRPANPVFYSTMREPGKININTLNEYVWRGVTGDPQWTEMTPYHDEENDSPDVLYAGRRDGNIYYPFLPAHVQPLWVTMNPGQEKPNPGFFTLLTGNNPADFDSDSGPLFDSLRARYAKDDAGNTIYETYVDEEGNTQYKTD